MRPGDRVGNLTRRKVPSRFVLRGQIPSGYSLWPDGTLRATPQPDPQRVVELRRGGMSLAAIGLDCNRTAECVRQILKEARQQDRLAQLGLSLRGWHGLVTAGTVLDRELSDISAEELKRRVAAREDFLILLRRTKNVGKKTLREYVRAFDLRMPDWLGSQMEHARREP